MFNNFFAGACTQIKIKNRPSTLGSVLGFYLFIFFALPFSFLVSFCCGFSTSTRLLSGRRISEKVKNMQELLTMDKQRVEREILL